MPDRVPVYVAHQLNAPTAAERDANRARATRWVAWLADRYLVAPVADWILLAGEWPETPELRATGLEIDRRLVELCGTIVLVGPRVSPGMVFESTWSSLRIDLTGLSDDAPTEEYLRTLCGDALAVEALRALDARMAAGGIERAHG